MRTYRKSVPKPTIVGAGTAKAKKGLITVIYADDVVPSSWPSRDANGVNMVGNIILKAGATMHQLYLSQKTQKLSDEITGEEDMEAFDKKCEGVHPGNSLDIREFRANSLGVGLILIFDENCGANAGSVFGSPCNPFKLKGSYANDSEGIKNVMQFAPDVIDATAIGLYTGAKVYAENFASPTVDTDLTVANGPVQQLPSLDTTDAITAASIDLENDTIVSLIGGGGTDPATLDAGVQGVVTVILNEGSTWTALKDAVINLQVKKGGATTYLVEVSRA